MIATAILLFLLVLVYLDPEARLTAHILVEQLFLDLRRIPLRLRLEWDIFWIMRNKNKYLKMAQEIRHELEQTGAIPAEERAVSEESLPPH